MSKLEKKHRLIFSISSFILIAVCIIGFFLPRYSVTDPDTGETWIIISAILGSEPENFENLYSISILLTMIPIILIIFVNNLKYIEKFWIMEFIFLFSAAELMTFDFMVLTMLGLDNSGFIVVPLIGNYLRVIYWFGIWIPLLYLAAILYILQKREEGKNPYTL